MDSDNIIIHLFLFTHSSSFTHIIPYIRPRGGGVDNDGDEDDDVTCTGVVTIFGFLFVEEDDIDDDDFEERFLILVGCSSSIFSVFLLDTVLLHQSLLVALE